MKMITTAFTFLFVFGYGMTSQPANHYIDSVLNTGFATEIRNLKYDPATLSNFVSEFEDNIRIIGKVKVTAEFYNGSATGLSKVKRNSQCNATRNTIGVIKDRRSIACTISFDNIAISYQGKLKYGKMPRSNIQASGKMSGTLIDIEVVQLVPMTPALKAFSIQKIGTLKMKFTGVGPFNKKVKKMLVDKFSQYVQANLFTAMTDKIYYALNRAVAKTSMPAYI